MYLSDCSYSYTPKYWKIDFIFSGKRYLENWMLIGAWEWTLTRFADTTSDIAYFDLGTVDTNPASTALAIRPVFNLKSDVKIIGGLGTKELPLIID